MKLHWFSPLPPAESEIANHTARLLPTLRQSADVVLWTDRPGWDAGLERLAPVRQYAPETMPWEEFSRGGLAVFNIGNDAAHHGTIWQVSRRQSGIVILHDTHLQHLFLGRCQQGGHLDEYRSLMGRHYGRAGAAAADDLLAGRAPLDEVAGQFPLTEQALENALGVMVHAPAALAELRKGQWPVALACLPYIPGPRRPPAPTGPPFRLVLFGFIGANRRLEGVLGALARYPRRETVRLDIYGRLHDEQRFRSLADEPRLRGLVTFHGFVDEPSLRDGLAAAHLAINLRHPTMGEASASQLRIWEHALPSVVTPVGWYACQPEGTLLFVRPEHEEADIHRALDGLLADPARYRQVGEAGRQQLEKRHGPQGYVEALTSLASRACQHQGEVLARRLARRLADHLSSWPPGLLDSSCRRLACQLHWLFRRD